MLENFNGMLQDAYKTQRAIGSFNFYNYETLKGILMAAKKEQSAVIVSFGAKYLKNMSLREVHLLTNEMAGEHPVCLHLDHCSNPEIIYQAIQSGFTSVMYDGSALPYEENMKNTRQICKVAHPCGVSVEAELGSLAAGEHSHEGTAEDREVYTDSDVALRFVQETEVDALAVSIGTVHGMYKGTPNIRVDILKEINAKLGMPLVLHGGSGTPEEKIRDCISNGIAKINVNTEISDYAVANMADIIGKDKLHLSVLSLKEMDFVAEVVRKYIRIFMNA